VKGLLPYWIKRVFASLCLNLFTPREILVQIGITHLVLITSPISIEDTFGMYNFYNKSSLHKLLDNLNPL
jgi:hypothetical protein